MPDRDTLKGAIATQHGGRAAFVYKQPVRQSYGLDAIWVGDVYVFDLKDNPKATRAYAWSASRYERRFCAVLQLGDVGTAADAVRISLAGERRAGSP